MVCCLGCAAASTEPILSTYAYLMIQPLCCCLASRYPQMHTPTTSWQRLTLACSLTTSIALHPRLMTIRFGTCGALCMPAVPRPFASHLFAGACSSHDGMAPYMHSRHAGLAPVYISNLTNAHALWTPFVVRSLPLTQSIVCCVSLRLCASCKMFQAGCTQADGLGTVLLQDAQSCAVLAVDVGFSLYP